MVRIRRARHWLHHVSEKVAGVYEHWIVSTILFVFTLVVFVDALGEIFPRIHEFIYLHHYDEVYFAGAKVFDASKNVVAEVLSKTVRFILRRRG